jgi:hypothetical protein
MRWGWQWTLIILAVGLADFAARFGTGFNMVWVVRSEAVLLLGGGLALWILQRRNPAQIRWQRRVQRVLVALFGLGGLRAALWASGMAVARANVVVLVLGVLVGTVAWWRGRRVAGVARAPGH